MLPAFCLAAHPIHRLRERIGLCAKRGLLRQSRRRSRVGLTVRDHILFDSIWLRKSTSCLNIDRHSRPGGQLIPTANQNVGVPCPIPPKISSRAASGPPCPIMRASLPAIPFARQGLAVMAADPEPEMLLAARHALISAGAFFARRTIQT